MLTNMTIQKMQSLKLGGMAQAFEDQLADPNIAQLSFEERVGLLIDREETHRANARIQRLLKQAKFKYPSACVEDIDYTSNRGLDKSVLSQLLNMTWIEKRLNLTITGPTGTGKTWLANAIGNKACRSGISTLFYRISFILEECKTAKLQGEFIKTINKFTKPDLLIIDDFGVGNIDSKMRGDLLEVIESRSENKSTIITSQLPTANWHDYLGDTNKTSSDAIIDRILGGCYKLELKGDSLRKHKKL
ncbi:MAG: IS21-like element helper ATPase IstB [Deferribacterales bacterium]